MNKYSLSYFFLVLQKFIQEHFSRFGGVEKVKLMSDQVIFIILSVSYLKVDLSWDLKTLLFECFELVR